MKRTFSTPLAPAGRGWRQRIQRSRLRLASAPRASVTANAERAFQIDMSANRALLQVSGATVSQAEQRARTRMTVCLTRELVQITEASRANARDAVALKPLSEEAGVEYEMTALQPVVRPLLNGVHRLLTLHLPKALRATIQRYLTAFAKVQALNACADARTWLAAGLTAAHEPRGIAQIASTVTDFHRLTNGNAQAVLGDLPPAQLRALTLEKARAAQHIDRLTAQSVASLEAWIKRVVAAVAKAATASTTTLTKTTS